jgi:hypothetical protein
MSTLTQILPRPLPANLTYQAIQVESPSYDPVNRQYTARVYGVCRGHVMPLIIGTALAVHRIEDVVITDTEIDAVLLAKPELGTDRIAAALARAFERLYALAAETQEAPYNA